MRVRRESPARGAQVATRVKMATGDVDDDDGDDDNEYDMVYFAR